MREHYNLYYLFLEDKLKNSMPEEKSKRVRNDLQKNFLKNKTDSKKHPP